jgi:hypothetical protein
VLEETARIADHVAELELHRLEMRIDAFSAGRLQGAEQPIVPEVMISLGFGH